MASLDRRVLFALSLLLRRGGLRLSFENYIEIPNSYSQPAAGGVSQKSNRKSTVILDQARAKHPLCLSATVPSKHPP